MTRARTHFAFGAGLLAVAFGGGWLWAAWGPAALLNGVAAICG